MEPTLYSAVDWRRLLEFERPVMNSTNSGMSAHAAATIPVQIGLVEEKKMVIRGVGREGRALRIEVSTPDQRNFFSEIEKQVLLTMTRNSSDWFGGRKLSLDDVRMMFKRFIVDGGDVPSVMMRTARDLRVFICEDDRSRRAKVSELEAGMPCCIIFKIQGLWVEESRFGVSMTISDVLAFPVGTEDSGSESDEEPDTEVRRRFFMSRAARPDLTDDEALFRSTCDAPLHDRGDASDGEDGGSWESRMPFGLEADRGRSSAARLRLDNNEEEEFDDDELDLSEEGLAAV